MLHPFEPFKAIYIPKLLELKKPWLVSQTYNRYDNLMATEGKTSLLLTDYSDSNAAREHLKELTDDKYAALINLRHPSHKAKVLELIGPDSRYHVFWAVIKSARELEDQLNRTYKESIRRYIQKHTNWRISRETTLHPSLRLVFGELCIILKYGSQTLRVKFEDIETA